MKYRLYRRVLKFEMPKSDRRALIARRPNFRLSVASTARCFVHSTHFLFDRPFDAISFSQPCGRLVLSAVLYLEKQRNPYDQGLQAGKLTNQWSEKVLVGCVETKLWISHIHSSSTSPLLQTAGRSIFVLIALLKVAFHGLPFIHVPYCNELVVFFQVWTAISCLDADVRHFPFLSLLESETLPHIIDYFVLKMLSTGRKEWSSLFFQVFKETR